jgi:hypothetical protein
MDERVYIKVKLGQLLNPKTHKVAISLPELVQQTNAFSVKNRPGCVPVLQDSNPPDLYLRYKVTCNLPDSDPAGHDVRVHFDVSKIQETTRAQDLDVRVSCSCPAFLYWGAQWNLHQRDGLEGEPRPLLTAPTERLDLRTHFVICKHCKAVMDRILPSVQHNISNILRKVRVQRNKELLKQQEEQKHQDQDLDKRKKLVDKIRTIRDEKTQKRMLDELSKKEEENLQHLKDLEEEAQKSEPHEVEREQPATLEEQKAPAKLPAWIQRPLDWRKKLMDKIRERMQKWRKPEKMPPPLEYQKRTPEEEKAFEDLMEEELNKYRKYEEK